MADFIIAGPDGKKYKVSGENAEGALAALKKSLGQTEPAAVVPPSAPAEPPQKNPDGTYGQVPEGMVLNPVTGQMTSRELLAQNMQPNMAESAIAGGAQGSTFGLSDEGIGALNAVLPGKGTMADRYDFGREYARAMLDSARKDHAVAAYGGELAGGAVIPAGAGGSVGKMALSGGLTGLGYGFGTGEGGLVNRLENARDSGAAGAVIGGTIGGLGKIVQALANKRATGKAIKDIVRNAPSTEALKDAGSAAYKAIDDAGVMVNPSAVRDAGQSIVADMTAGGLDRGGTLPLTPKSARLAEILDEAGRANDPVPFSAIDQIRRKAGIPASDTGNKVEAALGAKAIAGLDDMVNGLTPNDIAGGDLQTLQTMLPKARDLWARMSRSQLVDDAIAAGDSYISGSGSGIRNQFARIIRNPKLARGFSDAELAVMKRVSNGSIPEKMLHLAGGGIGNIATMLGGGLGGGGLPGAAAGFVAAAGLRKASDMVTRRNAEIARALIAGGGLKGPVQASDTARLIAERLLQRASRPLAPWLAESMSPAQSRQ